MNKDEMRTTIIVLIGLLILIGLVASPIGTLMLILIALLITWYLMFTAGGDLKKK